MSGVDYDGREIRKGAVDAVERYIAESGGSTVPELRRVVERIAGACVRKVGKQLDVDLERLGPRLFLRQHPVHTELPNTGDEDAIHDRLREVR